MTLIRPHRNRCYRPVLGLAAVACALVSQPAKVRADEERLATKPNAAAVKFFETRVRPVLVERCYNCHGPDTENEAGLRLDSLAEMLKGGRSGPAIKPGNPKQSLLILSVNHNGPVQMPPKTKLPQLEIAVLTKWVKMGAPWPNAKQPSRPNATSRGPVQFSEDQKSFWAFQPVVEPPLPRVRQADWPRSPLDHFVLVALEAKGLTPAPSAGKRTLIRRATIDLHGLPPTPKEIEAFLSDDFPDAFATVVDRLLASPRYGERWGRHWLDVVRYADSNGMDDNMAYVDAWRYRDYVISAFNKDKPYNRFVQEQLAGDLFPPADGDAPYEGLIATGFLMIGPKMLAEDDPVKQQMDIVDDQIDTVGRAFLGLTLGCGRCHDHKFDPFPTADYYALAGIFKSTLVMMSYRVDSKWNSRALGDAGLERRLSDLEQQVDALDRAIVLGNFVNREGERKKLQERLSAVTKEYATIPKAMAAEEDRPEDLQVFLRGNHLTRGELAPRGFPRILAGEKRPALGKKESGRRQLAEWMTRPDHPLIGRVMVNRIWKGHFGHGIVRTLDNFGRLGQRPDNQPLLDWLSSQFVKRGWSIKSLHRLIMRSSTYQMSTRHQARAAVINTQNRLLWRMNRRRMEAEVIRDSLLAVSGQIDFRMGGPVLNDKTFVILSAAALKDAALYRSDRRSVYLPVLRSGLYDVFQAFDFPDPAVVSGQRSSTTVAPQALFMMNGDLMSGSSKQLAARLLTRTGWDDEQRVRAGYDIVYGRPPTQLEIGDWLSFVAQYTAALDGRDVDPATQRLQTWQAVCRVLLSSNEFIYVE